MRLHALAALVALSASLCAAPADSIFPLPPSPAPVPAPPAPGGLLDLKTGELYVVNSPADGALLVWPKGLVSVSKRKGPLTLDAVFADAKVPGESETRDYAGPFLWLLKPVAGKSGALAITFIPKTWVDEKEFQHAAITVNHGPQPPPPIPDPPKPTPTAAAWVIVVEESSLRTPEIAAVVNDLAMWKRVEAKGVKWRVYDADSPDAKAKNYDVLAKGVGLPAVLLLDASGGVVRKEKLPAKPADLEAMVK